MKSVERKFEITGFCTAFGFEWRSDFVFNGESHEMWEIVFISDGRVESTEDEKVYILEKNNIILHAPWEFHRIRSAQRTSPSGHIMSFFAKGDLPSALKEGIFTLTGDMRIRYVAICERIEAFLHCESESDFIGQELADSLSAFLIEISGEKVNAYPDMSSSAIEYRKIVVAMSKAVCENKTLADFAIECGDSVSYMKQLFKKYAGISPKTCYNKLRVRYAAQLLDEGMSVGDVAERMDFSSSNYFSAFFKKYTGISPVRYKNKAEGR